MNINCVFNEEKINISSVIEEIFEIYAKVKISENLLKNTPDYDIIKDDERSPIGGVA